MTPWTQPAFEAVAAVVSRRAGLTFTSRHESAESGIRRAMAKARIHDPRAYADRIAADDGAFDDLLNELTVGETYFFREPAHFQFIKQRVVPDVLGRGGAGHVVRVWSAACATGEEAYSLAILFEQLGLASQTVLAATDISREALAKARQGLYGDWSLRGDGAPAALAYLTKVGKQYQVADRLRRQVRFSAMNLALDMYPSFAAGVWGMDLILCRNVLIYFDKDTVRRTAERMYQTLAAGGWLVTASSDPPLWDFAPFEVVAGEDGLFYRKSGVGGAASVSPSPVAERVEEESAPVEASEFGPVAGPPLEDAETDEAAAVRGVRALANQNPAAAAAACARATARHPLSAELHYLNAVLLLDRARPEEAVQALRRVIYLDRTLAVAHVTLGAVLRSRGDVPGAGRAYRNARDLCRARPADEAVPLADGEPAGRLAETAAAELAILDWKE